MRMMSVCRSEYINFFTWPNGGASVNNMQSDPDINETGATTGCIFADVTATNTGPWKDSNEPSYASFGGNLGFEMFV